MMLLAQRFFKNINFQQKNRFSSLPPVAKENPFPLQNIPFGHFSLKNYKKLNQIGAAYGDTVINVSELSKNGFFKDFSPELQESLKQGPLNNFFSFDKKTRAQVRERVQEIIKNEIGKQGQYWDMKEDVQMLMPVRVGDYTDFYASRNHAENVGEMFRGPDNKLQPNWLHMPIGYHGRSSSINVDTTVKRPWGQIEIGEYGPENRLDIELEMAMILGGKLNQMGDQIHIDTTHENIAGFCIMNDLSARRIQKIEYVPLGPFLGKNFSTVISPWVVFPEALEKFVDARDNQPDILQYLQKSQKQTFYDIPLYVYLQPKGSTQKYLISESNMKHLYWSFDQMIAHHSLSGCNMLSGDMLASGTISGKDKAKQTGSMLELSWGGKVPIKCGEYERRFLEDGDTVFLEGGREVNGQYIGFGSIQTTILPNNKI